MTPESLITGSVNTESNWKKESSHVVAVDGFAPPEVL